jgi:hypothetical protein
MRAAWIVVGIAAAGVGAGCKGKDEKRDEGNAPPVAPTPTGRLPNGRPDPARVRFDAPPAWVVDRGMLTLALGEIVYVFSYGTEDPTPSVIDMTPTKVPGGTYYESPEGFYYVLDNGIICGGSHHRGGMYENMPAARDTAVADAKKICASGRLAE